MAWWQGTKAWLVKRGKWLAGATVVWVAVVGFCNFWVLRREPGPLWRPAQSPSYPVALVLGTSPRIHGRPNRFFEYRMDAAAELWKLGRVRHFILSGDGAGGASEPRAMAEGLVRRGVPREATTRDEAGFRTLDSIYRARDVYGVDRMLIVTDAWHLPRALYLAHAAGLVAEGVQTAGVAWSHAPKTRVREWFSRFFAVLDVNVLHTRPRSSGPKVGLVPEGVSSL